MARTIHIIGLTTLLILTGCVSAYSATLIEIINPEYDDIIAKGFELKKGGDIDIEAVGISLKYHDDLNVYAWIIDHNTRELVWVMKERQAERVSGSKVLYKEETSMKMAKGEYELYLFSGSSMFSNISIRGTGDFFDFLGDVFGDDHDRDFDKYLDDCYVKLSSDQISAGDIALFEVTGDLPNAVIKYNKLGDSEYIQSGFTLNKTMKIHIYAVFEYPGDYKNPVDYGWIVNTATREKVWSIDRWNSDWAGGGRKNRIYNNEIELPKGDYLLYFVTDDSHSYEYFNTNPPYDPFNWGITIMPGKGFSAADIHIFAPTGKGEALVDLTRARDDDFLEQAFKLNKNGALHIYAVGEYSYGDREFADYGWIQNAATGEIAWEMTFRNTGHAGGAKKNRLFDDRVELPKGEYIAYYITDDSHSYRDFNDSPPFDPGAWGLAIYACKDFNAADLVKITKTDIAKDSDILVKMVRARDDERLRDKFTLTEQTRIHIYAIGEGDRDEMYDYGWIVDDRSNRSVWEMTWRNTEPAGGARKNRLYDGDLVLDPGTYEVYYVTDGSHSFNDWNSPRPHDPINWGITISRTDK